MATQHQDTSFSLNPLGGADIAIPQAQIDHDSRGLRIWLYFICLLVFAIVLVGGATRLTDSGLSITEWKPIHGTIPPLGAVEWAEEFEKYKQIPEYTQINKGMSLTEFKFIFWWEWGHRQLGRVIGLVSALGFVAFFAAGQLRGQFALKVALIPILVACQGAVGWWMVYSGLSERTDVSQYRLTTHLTLACVIFAYTLWLARGLKDQHFKGAGRFARWGGSALIVFILCQIALGGLVAGMDAGLAYNTWPQMDGVMVPSGLLLIEPIWLNAFENIKTIQFNHRGMAYFLLATSVAYAAVLSAKIADPLGGKLAKSAWILVALLLFQAAIGIGTLLLAVPIDWALVHQGGAIIVLAAAVVHTRDLFPSSS